MYIPTDVIMKNDVLLEGSVTMYIILYTYILCSHLAFAYIFIILCTAYLRYDYYNELVLSTASASARHDCCAIVHSAFSVAGTSSGPLCHK